jgi:hypothetical protein
MALMQLDAFMTPLIGIPFLGMQALEPFDTRDGELGVRIARQRGAYQANGPAVAEMIADVEERLLRSGLPTPPRPNTSEEYVLWSDVVVFATTTVTGPQAPEGALVALGRCVGELAQGLAISESVVRLRQVAPTNDVLRAIAEHYSTRTLKRVEWLDKMQRFPTLPAAARPGAHQLAATAQRVVKLEREHIRQGDFEAILNEIGAAVANLRAALGE